MKDTKNTLTEMTTGLQTHGQYITPKQGKSHRSVTEYQLGFQALISALVEKSKAYYFVIYPEPPKKSVLNDVMMKMIKAKAGNQPVYTLLVEIKLSTRV